MTNLNLTKAKVEALPIEIAKDIKETLTCYDEVFVTYEYGKYKVSTGCGICSSYAPDHRVVGTVYAKDIYTTEERKENLRILNTYGTLYP